MDYSKSDRGLRPRPVVGVVLSGGVGESEQGGEGAVVWCSLPAREHGFLFKALRPVRVRRVPLVARASPLVAGRGEGVERRQGRELREVAFVELISVLREW